MQVTPMFLGACAFASIAGAIGGATINTSPIQRAGIGSEMLPRADFAFDPADSGLPQAAPPDHYAMTTPEGRIEVAELSTHGLYSQQRFGWQTASYEPPPPADYLGPAPEPEPVLFEGEPAFGEPPAPVAEPAEPEQVTPRIVDVAAELAKG